MASSLTIFLLVSHLILILVSFVSGLFISFSDCIAYGCAGWHASTIFLPHFLLHMGHVRVLRRVRYDIPSFGWLPRLGRDLTADGSLVFQFFLFLLFLLIFIFLVSFPSSTSCSVSFFVCIFISCSTLRPSFVHLHFLSIPFYFNIVLLFLHFHAFIASRLGIESIDPLHI
jgi:hypothetical protein